jgi:hypothetical protein
MDYRVKKVGNDWKFLPSQEKIEKSDYEKLVTKIERKEKKIEGMLKKLVDEKKLLRKLKTNRTIGYNKMVKYHKKFLPNFSIFLDDDNYGNPQWGMWVSIGGKRKFVYLGTVSEVSYHLDLLENYVPHYNKNNSFKDTVGHYGTFKPKNNENNEHREIIKSKLELYVGEVLKNKSLNILKEFGDLDKFFDKSYKIKGTDILYDLYKKSPHYQPPQEERERKKGGRLYPLNVGKNKIW